jgi:Fic family protein
MSFIRKKRKGNTYYYELVENTRIEGNVVQKVLEYFPTLGAAVEYAKKHGIGMPSYADAWIDDSIKQDLEEKLSKLNAIRPLPKSILERLRDKFEVDMTYNSNAIEGNRLTLRVTWLVLRKGITVRGKSMKEHLEATNHAEAIELLEKLANSKNEIKEADILNLHAIILDKIDPQNAGFYRREQVYIEGSTVQLAKWKEIPHLMREVYKELNNHDTGIKAIYSAVKIHHQTVKIHPFVDGNGRLARLLMNLRLMRSSYPPTILRKEERRAYYSALEKADGNDFRALAMLIGKDILKALNLYIEAAE